jgi:cyclic-di-GMP phosphodiesterase TipF (flagellum assembly factor)
MIRLSALFVAICMVLIAGSFGALLYLTVGLTGAESVAVSVATLTGLAIYNTVSIRMKAQNGLSRQLGDLSNGTADLARQVTEQGRLIVELENKNDDAGNRALAAIQPVQSEMGELGALVSQLAQNVAAMEIAGRAPGQERRRLQPSGAPAQAAAAPSESPAWKPILRPGMPQELPPVASEALEPPLPANTLVPAQPEKKPEPAPPQEAAPPRPAANSVEGPFRGMTRAEIIALVGHAVGHNRIEIYLQPVVTLPQRKVRHYEALLRLRMPDDRIVNAADFVPFADAGGLMPELDHFMLTRCVRIVRRLQTRNRDVGVCCNLSASTLSDPEAFARFRDVAEANRAVASSLMFELAYPTLCSLGVGENENLAALTNLGYRLSADHVGDLRFDAADLAARKTKYLKISASVLLDKNNQATAKIHLADLSGFLTRFGIDLIAEKIENESHVIDLFDFDVKYGQGNLFSPPRPIRPESMADPEEADVKAAAAAAPPAAPAPVIRSTAERPTALSQIVRAVARQQGPAA